MRDAIKNFAAQFAWEPRIENIGRWQERDRFIVAGMGGSHLAAGLLGICRPELDLIIHRDYGLPPLSKEALAGRLVIASSYSGNTEETVDAFEEAGKQGLARAAISVGGKLLQLAEESGVPYIQMPDTGIQPRSALGFSFKAHLSLMGEEEALREASGLAETLRPMDYESAGRALAEKIRGRAPVVYTSSRNAAIGYTWKIKFNETSKIPAFANVFPELNHNEMTGFDAVESIGTLSQSFFIIILRDPDDHPRVLRRMDTAAKLLSDRGLSVETLALHGSTVLDKIFASLILADWASYYTALGYGVEPEQVPMVEEFKKMIA